jgi:hypothetical protein
MLIGLFCKLWVCWNLTGIEITSGVSVWNGPLIIIKDAYSVYPNWAFEGKIESWRRAEDASNGSARRVWRDSEEALLFVNRVLYPRTLDTNTKMSSGCIKNSIAEIIRGERIDNVFTSWCTRTRLQRQPPLHWHHPRQNISLGSICKTRHLMAKQNEIRLGASATRQTADVQMSMICGIHCEGRSMTLHCYTEQQR